MPWARSSFARNRKTFACILVLLALVLLEYHYFSWPQEAFDSLILLRGHQLMRAWQANGYDPPAPHADTFPPFQHFSADILLWFFPNNQRAVVRSWCHISAVCFPALIFLAWFAVARRAGKALAWLVVAILLTGPIVAYGAQSLNEVPAALVTLAFVVAVLSSRLIAAFIFFLLAGITKETACPILLLLWLACAWRPMLDRPSLRIGYLLSAAAGCLICYYLCAHLNLLRFGVAFNQENWKDYRLAPAGAQRMLYFLALWFSPNGGLCVFWPLSVAIIAPTLIIGARSTPRRRHLPPALFLIAAILMLFIGLAHWHQPMGWDAWGPRLLLPWIPSFVVAAILLYPEAAQRCAQMLLSNWKMFTLSTSIVLATCLPSFLVLSAWQIVAYWFTPDQWISRIPAPESGDRFYYDVQNYEMWMKRPIMLDIYHNALHHPAAILQGILYALAVFGVLYSCRSELLQLRRSSQNTGVNHFEISRRL